MPLVRVYTQDEVLAHTTSIKASWWKRYVDDAWWPDVVDRLPEDPARPGYQRIARRDVLSLAADRSPEGRVRLLLAAFMWGTGQSAFLVGRRVRVFTRTPLDVVGDRLVSAADLLHTEGPVAAYESLLGRQPNHVKYLGPAFFTKYLYFAAGHPATVDPRPLILDKWVARSLNVVSGDWSLRDNGWPGTTYGRYLRFAADHAATAGPDATPAGVEMGLFMRRRSSGL